MPTTVKITRKGQVTIPKEIRNLIGSDIIEFESKDGNIIVKPVKSVAGSLRKYAKKYVPLEHIREKIWEKSVHDRVGKKPT